MQEALQQGLSLVDVSGYIIIATILLILAAGVVVTFAIRARYASLSAELKECAGTGAFESPVLRQVVRDAGEAHRRSPHDVNTQVIIEQAFQSCLRRVLVGERFLKACTGLLIILGLVGTFYGLTLSIGKLAALVGGDVQDATAITESLTAGLTQALSGMSVAFSTSLFGILAAIVMTLLSVFFNVVDRRSELMGQIEAYLDNVLLRAAVTAGVGEAGSAVVTGGAAGAPLSDASVAAFARSVAQLESVVGQFDASLQAFATSTRDFREFNAHMKDNVQRMSLGFGDLSETLKEHARSFKAR